MTTAFVKAFDEPPPPRIDILTGKAMTQVKSTKEDLLNFRLDKELVAQQLEKSKYLSSPGPVEKADVNLLTVDSYGKDDIPEEVKQKALEEYESKVKAVQEAHDAAHQHATQAIERILRLDMGSSKDRMRVNFDKCIEKFGRHNTDAELLSNRGEEQQIKDRAGKDVGSSEVQIAIMTVKIRNLANFIESRGRKDHHNKRNLRLLVHKRQKMLKYLRRKERGGPRWQHVINTLGLTEATWKGEIVV
jgi:ribosomal protein S15